MSEEQYNELLELQARTQAEVSRIFTQVDLFNDKIQRTIDTLKSNKNKGKTDTLVSLALLKSLEKIQRDVNKLKSVV